MSDHPCGWKLDKSQPVWERFPSRVSGWIAGSNKLYPLHGDPGLICGAVKSAMLNNLPQEGDHTLCTYRKNATSLIIISLHKIAPLCILLWYACYCCNSINSLQNKWRNFWLIFLFATNYLGSRTISTLRPRRSKVERERSVKNWGTYTFTSCAFACRCDPGPLYPITPPPVDWSRLRIKGNSVFCSFELSNKQLAQLHWLTKVLTDHSFLPWRI